MYDERSRNNKMLLDLRKDAEERSRKLAIARQAQQANGITSNSSGIGGKSHSTSSSSKSASSSHSSFLSQVVDTTNSETNENHTPNLARLAEMDFLINGSRARSNTGDFVPPRWTPDEEVEACASCASTFDWFNRKHHCRHCGRIFCEPCSTHRVLLPESFGLRDPQRVCGNCRDEMLPLQGSLTNSIANHMRVNSIDVASSSHICTGSGSSSSSSGACSGDVCELCSSSSSGGGGGGGGGGGCSGGGASLYSSSRRYFNMPYSNTLGSEIRKAAYSIHNMFLAPNSLIKDRTLPLQLLANAQGVAFLTVAKGGFVFAPRVGTGVCVCVCCVSDW